MVVRLILLTIFILCLNVAILHAQWQPLTDLNGGKITSLLVNGNKLFAGTDTGGLFISRDNGASWNAVSPGLSSQKISCLAKSGNCLYAGTGDRGIFLSADTGQTWTSITSGLTDSCVSALLAFGDTVYAGVHGGYVDTGIVTGYNGKLFCSTDKGTTWTLALHKQPFRFTCLFMHNGAVFAGTDGSGILVSRDKGSSWTDASSGLPYLFIWSMAELGDSVFASIFDPGCDGGGLFRSADSGSTWNIAHVGLVYADVRSFAVSQRIIFAGIHENGVWYSTNAGDSWASFNEGYSDSGGLALAVSDSILFAGSERGRVWRRPLSEITAIQLTTSGKKVASSIIVSYRPGKDVTITFSAQSTGPVCCDLFSISGRKINGFNDIIKGTGKYAFIFNTPRLSSGTCIVRIKMGGFIESRLIPLPK